MKQKKVKQKSIKNRLIQYSFFLYLEGKVCIFESELEQEQENCRAES